MNISAVELKGNKALRSTTLSVAIVFLGQLLLGQALTAAERMRLPAVPELIFLLMFLGVPIAFFLVLRNTPLFGVRSRAARLFCAAVGSLLLWFLAFAIAMLVGFLARASA